MFVVTYQAPGVELGPDQYPASSPFAAAKLMVELWVDLGPDPGIRCDRRVAGGREPITPWERKQIELVLRMLAFTTGGGEG